MAAPRAKVARPATGEPVVLPGPAPRRRRRVGDVLHWTPRVERVGATALVVVALLPLAVAAVPILAAVGDEHPTMGDTALLELGVRRLGSEPLLLGPYSRFGWLHPGPAPFVALAPAYWSTGGDALGLNFGALALNAGCIIGVAVLAWRRGGAPLLAWAVVLLALLVRLLGPAVYQSPWNPYLAILPLALLVLLAWSIACGSRWSLPVAVALGSAIVQTHIGYGPVVAVLLSGSVVLLLTRSRCGLAWPLLVSGAVAMVLWAPTVLEELMNDPGNVSSLRTYLEDERDTQGLRAGAELAGAQFGRLPASVVGIELGDEAGLATGGPGWPTAVSAAALTLATVVAWRRRLPDVLRLVPLVVLFAAASVVAASSIDGEPYAYLVTWMTVGGFTVWLAVAAVLVPWRRAAGRVPAMLTAAVAVAGLSLGGADAAADTPLPEADVAAVMADLVPQLDEAVPPGDCPVLVRWSGNASWAWGVGVVVALHKDGRDVRVDRRWRYMFGERVARGTAGGPTLDVVAAPDRRSTGPVVAKSGGLRVHLQPGTCGP